LKSHPPQPDAGEAKRLSLGAFRELCGREDPSLPTHGCRPPVWPSGANSARAREPWYTYTASDHAQVGGLSCLTPDHEEGCARDWLLVMAYDPIASPTGTIWRLRAWSPARNQRLQARCVAEPDRVRSTSSCCTIGKTFTSLAWASLTRVLGSPTSCR